MRMWILNIPNFLILGSALGMISLIVTKTYIFERIRAWVKSKSKFFGKWIECPICFSTWTSFIGTFLTDRIVQTKWLILDVAISWFFLDFVVCLSAGILYKLYKSNE